MEKDKIQNGYHVYMIQCADGTLYTGYTTDVESRVKTHNEGKGAKYTKPETRRPVRLVYTEAYDSKGEALSREAVIKRLRKDRKLALIAGGFAEKLKNKTPCSR